MKRLVCIAALALAAGAMAQGQTKPATKPAQPPKSEATINWSGPVLKATGSGAPDMRATSPAQARLGAEMAAKMDAFRNLLAQAKGIQVSAGRTVADEMAKDEIRGKVEGIIRGYKVTAKRYFSDQGVELDVEVPLGALADALLPAVEDPKDDPAPEKKKEGEKKHSGIIVDATGLGVSPALAPRLLDESGAAVYGPDVISADARKELGVASYFPTLDEAKKSQRVGEKPLVIKAAKVQGSDLILSADALKALRAANQNVLAEGRVAIVFK